MLTKLLTGKRLVFLGMVLLFASNSLRAGPIEAKTKLDSNGKSCSKMFSHQRAYDDGVRFSFDGTNEGELTVAGKTFKITAELKKVKGKTKYYFGVDCDGDGTIKGKEGAYLSKSMSAKYTLTWEEDGKKKTYPIMISNCFLRWNKEKKIIYFATSVSPLWCRTGKIGKTKVMLLDSNLDGKFTQDGEDTFFPRSYYGVPLHKTHKIKDKFYDLEVSEDGEAIKAEEKEVSEIAQVSMQKFSKLCKSLVISDGEQAFDIITDGKKGIPAGTYHVVHAIFAKGSEIAFMDPRKRTAAPKTAPTFEQGPDYKLEAGKLNLIRSGAPVTLAYSASLSANTVKIKPGGMRLYGPVGERFRLNKSIKGTPSVYFCVGKKVLKKGKFESG